MQAFSVISYRLLSLAHWRAREKQIISAFCFLEETKDIRPLRIIDVGCGPGLLISLSQKQGYNYLGIDLDDEAIKYARLKYLGVKTVDFIEQSFDNLEIKIGPTDIVIFNGMIHHLDDIQLLNSIKKLHSCLAVIILDHVKVTKDTKFNFLIPRLLQKYDKGKYVREFDRFLKLDGLILLKSETFTIRMLGIPCWPYFCNVYSPAGST